MFDSQPQQATLLNRSALPVRPEAYRPPHSKACRPVEHLGRDMHSACSLFLAQVTSKDSFAAALNHVMGYRPLDRTRDAMDKAPLQLRSHGFCRAHLCNNERLHQALGYRALRQAFEKGLLVGKLQRGRKRLALFELRRQNKASKLGGILLILDSAIVIASLQV